MRRSFIALMLPVVMLTLIIAPVAAQEFEKQYDEVDLMHQTAAQFMSANQFAEAAEELKKVVAAEPDRLDAWTDLATCYKKLKDHANAAAAYQAASDLSPGNMDLLSNLGYMQLASEQYDEGIITYEKMLALDSVSYDANIHLGFIYGKKGDIQKALPFYEAALAAKPGDVQTLGSLAQMYADNGNTDKSVEMYQRAIEVAGAEQKATLRAKLGSSLIKQKQYDKAAEVYGALVEANGENPAHRFNLGISLMQMKQHGDAVPHLEKVIELRPDYGAAYQQLAMCYNNTNRFDSAIATVRKGLGATDQKGGLYCQWGKALEKKGLYEEAKDQFQRAVNDPQWGDYAKKQLQRQDDLIKRAQMIKQQG